MKEHLIQLRIQSRMSLASLIESFPATIMMTNPEQEPNANGHKPLEIIYIKKVIKVAEQI